MFKKISKDFQICNDTLAKVRRNAFFSDLTDAFRRIEIFFAEDQNQREKLIQKFLNDTKRVKKVFDSGCPIINAFTELSSIIKKWEKELK